MPSETPVAILAAGRLALGAAALAAPRRLVRSFGLTGSPELDYMTRIFGARAIALGSSWLGLDGASRRLVQRLALAVDLSDTAAGMGHLRRGDVPRPAAAALVGLTGAYAMVGAAYALHDR
jgi:hypothetical protein